MYYKKKNQIGLHDYSQPVYTSIGVHSIQANVIVFMKNNLAKYLISCTFFILGIKTGY